MTSTPCEPTPYEIAQAKEAEERRAKARAKRHRRQLADDERFYWNVEAWLESKKAEALRGQPAPPDRSRQ